MTVDNDSQALIEEVGLWLQTDKKEYFEMDVVEENKQPLIGKELSSKASFSLWKTEPLNIKPNNLYKFAYELTLKGSK